MARRAATTGRLTRGGWSFINFVTLEGATPARPAIWRLLTPALSSRRTRRRARSIWSVLAGICPPKRYDLVATVPRLRGLFAGAVDVGRESGGLLVTKKPARSGSLAAHRRVSRALSPRGSRQAEQRAVVGVLVAHAGEHLGRPTIVEPHAIETHA